MTTKRKEAKYTFKVYKKGKKTHLATHTITTYSSEEAIAQLKYEYWKKYSKDIVIVELISSTKLHEWCLFYITSNPNKKYCTEHHLYTKAFSLEEAKKFFKPIINQITDEGYMLYASKELRKRKK